MMAGKEVIKLLCGMGLKDTLHVATTLNEYEVVSSPSDSVI